MYEFSVCQKRDSDPFIDVVSHYMVAGNWTQDLGRAASVNCWAISPALKWFPMYMSYVHNQEKGKNL